MLNPEQQKTFATLTCNTRVRVRFAEVTDPIWIRPHQCDDEVVPTDRFLDADEEPTFTSDHVDIIRGNVVTRRVREATAAWVCLDHETLKGEDGEPVSIRVTAAHLRDLEVLEAGDRWNRRETTIPGLGYTFVQRADGILEVGCQKIPREGQEQIVRLLAERLDLEVVPAGYNEEGAKTFLALAALVSHLHCLPTGLDDFLGEDLYAQVMRALGRDDVLAERQAAAYGPGQVGGASYTGGQDGGQY